MDEDEELAAKQSLWGSLVAQLEAQCVEEDDDAEDEPFEREGDGMRCSKRGDCCSISLRASWTSDILTGSNLGSFLPRPLNNLPLSRQLSLPSSLSTTESTTFNHLGGNPSEGHSSSDISHSQNIIYEQSQKKEKIMDYHLFHLQSSVELHTPQQQQRQQQQQQQQQYDRCCREVQRLQTKQQSNNSTMGQRIDEERTFALTDWIHSYGHDVHDGVEMKEYIDKSVKIAHLVTSKLLELSQYDKDLTQNNGGLKFPEYGKCERCYPQPEDINEDCIIVTLNKEADIECIHFDIMQDFDWAIDKKDDVTNQLYDLEKTFDALGRLFFTLFMKGEKAPPLGIGELKQFSAASEQKESNDKIRDLDSSNQDDEKDEIISTMKAATVTPHLCRLVSDLLRSCPNNIFEHGNRNSTIFTSLSDVLSHLRQMIDYPDAFLYGTMNSRWELVFGGNRLFGRGNELKILLDAARRVGKYEHNPENNTQQMSSTKEVVMISGSSGCGKSRLVHEIRKPLISDGWLFLRCKFENSIHSEPLSVVSMAFDEYFSSTSLCCNGLASWQNTFMNPSPNKCVCPNPGCPIKLCRQLESKLGFDGLSSLSQQMPNLSRIINQMYQSQRNLLQPGDVELSFATPVQKHRTNFLFATLLDTLTSLCKVTLFVDDVSISSFFLGFKYHP